MEFGFNFFPDVSPQMKSGQQYFREALNLAELGERYGYNHVRIVEHYFKPYGGYSPNPVVFLAAAAQRTHTIRLVTGAVLPVFNNPLKLAGELGMLDAISNGRLDIGVARAFLPHEFATFGVSMDESRARFEEGFAALRVLLEQEEASFDGNFHCFHQVTSLPRPVQQPHPPYWVAAMTTAESFAKAGANGHNIMAIPLGGAAMRPLLETYRAAYRTAGHAGQGKAMLAFHMYCAPTDDEAQAVARPLINGYMQRLVAAASEWDVMESKDYQHYPQMIARLKEQNFDTLLASGAVWVGSPASIRCRIAEFAEQVGGFESASLQVMYGTMPEAAADRSIRLFAEQVMPTFRNV
jgi:alkanesulfonate monooxygenase SsuD/methylene tetrahydromethanopterin reductase-like flavin-dependent oxidoreductase (luciferase family)